MPLNLTNDFDCFDGVQLVTFQRRTLTGTVTTYSGVQALQRATRGGLVTASQGTALLSETTRWHLRRSTLPVAPRRGDRILADSGVWEVASDDLETWGTRYVCETRKVG